MARITYTPVAAEYEYADARYNVLLDGLKVAEVIRMRESRVDVYAGRTYGRPVTSTNWTVEAQGYTQYVRHTVRADAVVDFLTSRGMAYGDARRAAGKRGL